MNIPLQEGFKLNQFIIQSLLGHGGFGITYVAQDLKLDAKVAVKEFFPGMLEVTRQRDGTLHCPDPEKREVFERLKQRFLLEARSIAKFRHPNIVRVHTFFEENGTAYFTMDLEAGESCSRVLDRVEWRNEEALLSLFLPVLDALRLVHAAGIIHRDIKPANILLRPDGSPVLLDFGAAREYAGENRTMTTFLTPGYAPFEQYLGKSGRQGPWSDIYSLAAVLYRAVAGKTPPDAITRGKALSRKEPDPLLPAVEVGRGRFTRAFLEAVDLGLTFNDSQRPRSVDQWMERFPRPAGAQPVAAAAAPAVADKPEGGETEVVAEHLARVPFFRGIALPERRRIAKAALPFTTMAAGQTLFARGEAAREIYLLLAGRVRIFKEGEERPLSEISPGEMFGEFSFLSGAARSARAVAVEKSLLLALDPDFFAALLPELREKLKERLLSRAMERMWRMNRELGRVKRMRERLARLRRTIGNEGGDDDGLYLDGVSLENEGPAPPLEESTRLGGPGQEEGPQGGGRTQLEEGMMLEKVWRQG